MIDFELDETLQGVRDMLHWFAQEEVRLAQAQTSLEQARLNLQRVVGLPLESPLTLTDELRFTDEPLPAVNNFVEQAEQNRREVRIAEEQLRLNGLERRASHSLHCDCLLLEFERRTHQP